MQAMILTLMISTLLPLQPDGVTSRPADDQRAGGRGVSTGDLLDAIPEDASFAVVANLRGDSLLEDMLTSIARVQANTPEAGDLTVALFESIPGAIAIGVLPDPRGKEAQDVVIVMDIAKPGFDFRDWLDNRLLPVIRSEGRRNRLAGLRVEGDGGALRIVDPKQDNKTVLYISVRGGRAVFGTRASSTLASAKRREGDKSFADAPGVRKILRDLPADAPFRFLFNPAPILKAQRPPEPRSTEALLRQILQPEDLVAAGGFLRWRGRVIEIGATALLAEETKGVARWLDRSNSESRLMRRLAGEFPLIARVGVTSLTAVPDGVYSITDEFDETISTEYREDLANFNKTTGIDFNASILGQIQDELVIGVRPDFSQQPPVAWTAIARLGDPALFESACGKLANHFGLQFDTRTSEGVAIHSAPQPVSLAWCVAGNTLVLADGFTTARDTIRRLSSEGSKNDSATMEKGMRDLGAANQMMLLTDVGLLSRQAPMLPALVGPKFGPLLSGGYVGASLARDDRKVQLRLRWELGGPARNKDATDGAPDELLSTLTNQLVASLKSARRQAQRVIGMSNMRTIVQGMFVYAQSHENRFPESLEAFAATSPDMMPLSLLNNPYTDDGPEAPSEIAEYSHVIYRPGLTTQTGPDEVVLAERSVQTCADSTGANFAFADGHCEFVVEPTAGRLIEMIQAGEPSVTIAAAEARLAEENAP
ncbi:MAG TPA: hypothetical protein P5081_13280 [Phycisphaerae bacterium]|nr:hypothetical protein [Phycisphaerae bacterium]HRW53848.1 hypothetical protein [Phycisphaerae bacterium]